MVTKIVLYVFLGMLVLSLALGGIAFRNWWMHKKLTDNWSSFNRPSHKFPYGFEVVTDENGGHAGYFIWLLGPYEYRDSRTGELMWTE